MKKTNTAVNAAATALVAVALVTGAAQTATAAESAKTVAAEAAAHAKAEHDFYAAKRVRKGKTRKDAANGARAKNQQNRDTRAMWQGDSKRAVANFPWSSCNGKRNRYQVTGKGGQTVYLRTGGAAATGFKK